MIDIHSHVLWGVDDGPETAEESLALLRAAADSGTEQIVATPHASPEFQYDGPRVRERFVALQEQCDGRIRLHLGCDFHLSFDNIQDALANPRKYTIAGGPYLLVEFSDLAIFNTSERDLGRLIEAGMIPIITHPERNPLLRQRKPLLARWVEQGVRIQVTAAAYLGRFGRKANAFADELTGDGLVHFVASDAHHVRSRPPGLADARDYISRKWGADIAERLVAVNPHAVLAGDPVPASIAPARKRSWWSRLTGR